MAKRINETPILRGEDARRFEELARTAHLRTVSPDIMKRMKENYERVNAAMVRSESKWIPCSDRLPEVNKYSKVVDQSAVVLVIDASWLDHENQVQKARLLRVDGGKLEWHVEHKKSPPALVPNITHWMPLPPAP